MCFSLDFLRQLFFNTTVDKPRPGLKSKVANEHLEVINTKMEENDEPTAPGKSCSIFQSSSIQTIVESKHELHVDELDIDFTLLHFFIHFGLCRQNNLTSIFLLFSSAEVAV